MFFWFRVMCSASSWSPTAADVGQFGSLKVLGLNGVPGCEPDIEPGKELATDDGIILQVIAAWCNNN